jgi:hypothetical protein
LVWAIQSQRGVMLVTQPAPVVHFGHGFAAQFDRFHRRETGLANLETSGPQSLRSSYANIDKRC